MMSRTLRFLLAMLCLGLSEVVRGSDAISAPMTGASASVTQPHVVAELIPEKSTLAPGQPFDVALHLHMDAGWHTYWINPGDAGLATTIKWTLPAGFTAGPIQWPTPEKHNMGPLMTYGYGGDVYLLTTITPPNDNLPQHVNISAKASWLVCQEECIPGKGTFTLTLDGGALNLRLPVDNSDFLAQARERVPVMATDWKAKAAYNIKPGLGQPGQQALWIQFERSAQKSASPIGHLYFFPEQANVLSPNEDDNSKPDPESSPGTFELALTLQQNGTKPDQISGVLVSDQPLSGQSKAIYIPAFPTNANIPIISASNAVKADSATPGVPDNSLAGSAQPTGGGGQATAAANSAVPSGTVLGTASASTEPAQEPAPVSPLTLGGVLVFAFLGGLILNLMPCVLPVLSLKVFSLLRHAGDNPKKAWQQGAAFTAGVVLSFWILAGLLLILRAAGNHLGWGFQMQDPRFVLGLIFLFFLLGLNLFGVFELGSSLVGLDARATGKLGGLSSSFGNGALATAAATPCTGPFMGSALGFAAQQPAFVSMLIFTFLAFGMAAPYLLLTIFPGALKFVPKPGAWMEAFKQFMGFLLMATVIFLVYVFGALTGSDQVPWLLATLLLAGVAAWIYGRWSPPVHSAQVRGVALVLALGLLVCSIVWGATLAKAEPLPTAVAGSPATGPTQPGAWQPWTPSAVDQSLARGQPVFVDFTAAWCLSCKVNERVALDTDAVKQAFTDKKVALFRADWTQADPAISQTLQKFNRDGVPLYLLYSPKDATAPQVLPPVLTPGIVLAALKGI